MAVSNILQTVQTWNKSNLAILENITPMIAEMNTQFDNFQSKIASNLGTSVAFDKPPRFQVYDSLVATFQSTNQRIQTLTVDQQRQVAYEFTNQERLFNVDKENMSYLTRFSQSAIATLGSDIERTVALTAVSKMTSQIDGKPNVLSGPFRFYGDGRTSINTFLDMDTALVRYHDFGSPRGPTKMFIPSTVSAPIVNSGMQQFTLKRNDEMANSWEIGEFGSPRCKFLISNQLPKHIAGTVGRNTSSGANILTVVSTNDPTGQAISQITFSGATASDLNAIKLGDMFQMQLGVSGQPDNFYLNFLTGAPSNRQIQFRATADAAADVSGNVVVNIYPTLQASVPNSDNIGITNNIVAGMKAQVMDSHVAGLLVGGDSFYLAIPRLPLQTPFDTSVETDDQTGVSLRMTYGALFGQNQLGIIHDVIFGATLPPEYCMRILFPLSTV